MSETDPTGKAPSDPGAKLDAGKPRVGLMFDNFPRALLRVADVTTYGANKYSDSGCLHVPDGIARYHDALARHLLDAHQGIEIDEDSGLQVMAQVAWNALIIVELMERERHG